MKRRNFLAAGQAILTGGITLGAPLVSRAQSVVIKFGQSASLTGGQSAYGKEVRDGIHAAFSAANKADGGRGPRFELVTLDDGGTRDRCLQNVKSLIDSGIVGLVGLTSGAAAEACLPMVEDAQIAMLGTATGNMGIRAPNLTTPFHVRAGYDDEYKRMLSYITAFGVERVGFVSLKDTSAANAAAMTNALDAVGVRMAMSVALDRNSKDFNKESETLVAANLGCILFTTNEAPFTQIVRYTTGLGYRGLYFTSSFAGQAAIDAMAASGQSVIVASVVPRPTQMGLPVVKRCQESLAALGTGTRLGFTSMEGFIAGQVAVEAARVALRNGGISRSRFKETLSSVRTDLGGYKVDFTGNKGNGSRFVDVIAVDRQGRLIG
jgi:branched-chain amino acid transport system substrate-binding protein